MKKITFIVDRRSVGTGRLPHNKGCGYGRAVPESAHKSVTEGSLDPLDGTGGLRDDSEGRDDACVVGCSARNGNAGRSANCNNAVSNGNDNYAGAFALNKRNDIEKHPTSQPSRLKTTESCVATGRHRQCDYGSLLYVDGEDKAESNATPSIAETSIWEELTRANKKRNLKGLERFYHSVEIAETAIRRCCSDQDTDWKRGYMRHAHLIGKIMVKEITEGTYYVRGYRVIDLPRRHESDKQRQAKVYTLYDRCVQMFILVIIEQKCRRKVIRNNYSNIEGRGILCNDKRYCMINKIRFATQQYPDALVLLTDIHHFYQSVTWKVLLGSMFEFIKDKTTRWLLLIIYKASGDMPIGSCLSPLFSDILMNDFDEKIVRYFKPHAYFAFGDNRMFIGDRETIMKIKTFQQSYYAGRFGLEVKGDYQICKVKDGFRFCKTWYDNGFVRIRAEMRRRAIRCARKPQSFAGYHGLLLKTDSKRLLKLILTRLQQMKNRQGIEIREFAGKDTELDKFVGTKIAVTNYCMIDNGKDSKFYVKLQFLGKTPEDVKPLLYKTNCGHHEIKQAALLWKREQHKMPEYVTVMQKGRNIFFKEYHVTDEEACAVVKEELNIDLSKIG